MACSNNQEEYNKSVKEIKDRKKTLSETLRELYIEAMESIDCLKEKKKQDI
jgi:hypothetical protein